MNYIVLREEYTRLHNSILQQSARIMEMKIAYIQTNGAGMHSLADRMEKFIEDAEDAQTLNEIRLGAVIVELKRIDRAIGSRFQNGLYKAFGCEKPSFRRTISRIKRLRVVIDPVWIIIAGLLSIILLKGFAKWQ